MSDFKAEMQQIFDLLSPSAPLSVLKGPTSKAWVGKEGAKRKKKEKEKKGNGREGKE